MSRVKFLVIFIFALLIIGFYKSDNVSAASIGGTHPNDGSNLIVSATGTYYSPTSVSYVYVPTSSSSGSVTLIDLANGKIRVMDVVTVSAGGGCTADVINGAGYSYGGSEVANNTALSIPQRPSLPAAGGTKELNGYRMYCVTVTTSTALNTGSCVSGTGCYSMNVTFRLSTSNGLIGNYPGPVSSQGTGYYRDAYASGVWDKEMDFAAECNAPSIGSQVVHLYDLDTYQASNNNMRIEVLEADRSPSASFAAVELYDPTTNGVDLNPDIFTFKYYPPNIDTGEYVEVRPRAGFQQNKKYRIRITGIGHNNKIRVRLPFDQLTVDTNCITNQPPTGHIELSCGYSGTATNVHYEVKTSDPDGDSISISNGSVAGSSFSNTSGDVPSTFGATGGASATINDGHGHSVNISDNGDYTCPSNSPPSPTITASCGYIAGNTAVARVSFTVGDISDPDGGGTPLYTVRIVLTSGAVSGSSANISDTSTGTYDVSRPSTGTIQVRMRDNQSHVYTAWVASNPAFSCPQPPPTVSCTISFLSSSKELGEVFTPSVAVTFSAPAGSTPLANTNVTNSLASAVPASQVSGPQSVNLGSTATFNFASNYSLGAVGTYTSTARTTWTAKTADDPGFVDCPSTTVTVVTKPYFKVVGGDIISNNRVKGWNKIGQTYATAPNDGTGKSGSGAQGLIVASNVIDGVMSGDMLTINYAGGVPKNLTLANTGTSAPVLPLYGGGFGGIAITMPIADANAAVWTAGSTSIGSFRYTGSTSYSGAIANKTRMTVDLTGDLTINGNITYDGATGGYPTVDDIPHIKFIVRRDPATGLGGHIYIAPTVGRIDAELVAEISIDTCSTALPNKYNVCSNNSVPVSPTLVINGSLLAPSLQLNRLIGTVRNSTAADGTRTGPGTYQNSGNISEIIQFTPELFMATPAEKTTSLGNTYDAVTALPPLF